MTAARRQFRRFAIDYVEILRLAQIEVAALEHLTQFALANAVGGRADHPAGADIVQRAGEMEGVREQIIAEQHAGLHAPDGVDRGHPATYAGIVEHVVVDQRGRVDHLDHGPQDVMRRRHSAAGAGGQQQQHRPQPFAAIVLDVIDDLGHARRACFSARGPGCARLLPGRRRWERRRPAQGRSAVEGPA